VIVPLRAGVLSALGLLIAPPAFDIVRTFKAPLVDLDVAAAQAVMEQMAATVRGLVEGLDSGGELVIRRAVDVGYIGQSYQVTVPVDDGLDRQAIWDRFAARYREKYGYFYDDVPAEVVNLRVLGELAGAAAVMAPLAGPGAAAAPAPRAVRPAYCPRAGTMVPFAVHARADLGPGVRLDGPLLVEEASATTVVDAAARVEVDALGSLVIELRQEEA
jgi:N-methylhydantoinase A